MMLNLAYCLIITAIIGLSICALAALFYIIIVIYKGIDYDI